jgi:hypothetical protein
VSHWDLLEGGQGLLAAINDGTTVAFHEGGELADAAIDAELEQAGPALAINGPAELTGELVACRAAGTAGTGAGELTFDSPALGWEGQAPATGTSRSIAVLLEDGNLVAVRTHGESDAHGDELRAGAITRGRKGQVDIADVRLSTEYGSDGLQRRATLELWLDNDDDIPCRGAGTLICGATREEGGIRRRVAFFAWSVEGRAGLGRYEIAKAS